MKKLIKLLVCACAIFAISGCGKSYPPDSPEGVALDFVKNARTGKFDDAYLKANCTEKSASWLKEALKEKEGDKILAEIFKTVQDSVATTEIKDDEAKVAFKTNEKKKDGTEKTETIKLKKVDGKWKVDFRIL